MVAVIAINVRMSSSLSMSGVLRAAWRPDRLGARGRTRVRRCGLPPGIRFDQRWAACSRLERPFPVAFRDEQDTVREGVGRPRRPRGRGRRRPSLHRPPPRARSHLASGLRGASARRSSRPQAGAHRGDDGSRRPDSAGPHRGRDGEEAARSAPVQLRGVRHRAAFDRDGQRRHRARDRPRARPHPARHDDRLRGFSTRPPTGLSVRSPSASGRRRSSTCWRPRRWHSSDPERC